MVICHKCQKNQSQINGWLERVNERGVPGIFECRPRCDCILTQEQHIIGALTGRVPDPNEKNFA